MRVSPDVLGQALDATRRILAVFASFCVFVVG
jgi:hypothetical protein